MSSNVKLLAGKQSPVPVAGTRIFAYKHFQTNQVVYSLSRILNNASSLKQLPFSGKQSLPNALRKDHWKPYFTVKFPIASQGLTVFKKLREWRKLHEYSWSKRDLRAFIEKQRPLDEARAEQKGVDDSQLSEKRLLRKQARRRMINTSKFIHDQKANSVADLASVLVEQERQEKYWRKGLQVAENDEGSDMSAISAEAALQGRAGSEEAGVSRELVKKQMRRGYAEKRFVSDVLKLLEDPAARDRRLAELKGQKDALIQERAAISRAPRGKTAKALAQREFELKSAAIRANGTQAFQILHLEVTFRKMYVRRLEELANMDYTHYYEYVEQQGFLTPPTPASGGSSSEVTNVASSESTTQVQPAALASKATAVRFTIAPKSVGAHDIYGTWADVVSTLESELRTYFAKPSTELQMDGVVVEWSDPLDANHAEKWPEAVQHEWMGIVRRNTPPANDSAKFYEMSDQFGYDQQGRLLEARWRTTRVGQLLGHRPAYSLPPPEADSESLDGALAVGR